MGNGASSHRDASGGGAALRHVVCDVEQVSRDEEQGSEEEQNDGGHGVEEMAVLITQVPHQHHHSVQQWRLWERDSELCIIVCFTIM